MAKIGASFPICSLPGGVRPFKGASRALVAGVQAPRSFIFLVGKFKWEVPWEEGGTIMEGPEQPQGVALPPPPP